LALAGLDALAASVDYLFLNRDEALLYSRQRQFVPALARWRRFPRLVVVKLGAGGSRVIGGGNGNIDVHAAAPTVRVVDTTGAGDAFNAGFLVARLRGSAITAALRLANRVGAMSTRRPGGISADPIESRQVVPPAAVVSRRCSSTV
jgi:sugar/nucleoside kinase (ribokinase family)